MKKILITGATGNVGIEVIKYIQKLENKNQIVAGVRDVDKGKQKLARFTGLDFIRFDFEDVSTFNPALENVDTVFLLRPPQISDIKKYFGPLVVAIKVAGIKEVVFLSVQGVEKSKAIPHNKIEKLITESGLDYVILRPSYFMQNLTTTLYDDIKQKRKIILPAGKAKFNWVDVKNIGEVAAIVLDRFQEFANGTYEITGYENENFDKVTGLINQNIDDKITYEAVNPIRFFNIKKNDGIPKGMILVMIMLHFAPRFQKEPKISDFYERLTGKKPTTLESFIKREKEKFAPPLG